MTIASVRFKSYQEYLDSDLAAEDNIRLLSDGDVIEAPPEEDENYFIADELAERLKRLLQQRRLLRTNSTEIQVNPIGDDCVNRKPDLLVLRPQHLDLMAQNKKSAILIGMPAPLFIAEIVSAGSEISANYRRDYEWKKQQYEWWQIPEYWVIDRHRQQVTVFSLQSGRYQESRYQGSEKIVSAIFPGLALQASAVLSGDVIS